MDPSRAEQLVFGILLAVIALLSLLFALVGARIRDREALMMGAGFGAVMGFLALVLCTGWVNLLPLPH
ncbi:hypothetical protein [Pseudonocardia asaccharolytica]|uniref:DUF2759 domain-containing protein n=1 Tax=Pseudonocardia asaccharolytica DSM 44247 = NBRC 16224 TaxID=1123024 RepID=A0A511D358_9PSEU|nr:hypothetical protein [Pseudonocardia asaccharolytica]GEL17338.1 hypothetical protein PA7_11750 [Pseudonocardia asaccharolytica DSM 44247 = NBRC 16224]